MDIENIDENKIEWLDEEEEDECVKCKETDNVSNLNSCVKCTKLFCNECLAHCEGCEEIICEKCADSDGFQCENCRISFCALCVSKNEYEDCPTCGVTYCSERCMQEFERTCPGCDAKACKRCLDWGEECEECEANSLTADQFLKDDTPDCFPPELSAMVAEYIHRGHCTKRRLDDDEDME